MDRTPTIQGTDHTTKYLINNARKSKKEGYTQRSDKNMNGRAQLNSTASLTTDKKVKLLRPTQRRNSQRKI